MARAAGGPARVVTTTGSDCCSISFPLIVGQALVFADYDFEGAETNLFRVHLDRALTCEELSSSPAVPGVEDVELAVDRRDIYYTDDTGGETEMPERGIFRIARKPESAGACGT